MATPMFHIAASMRKRTFYRLIGVGGDAALVGHALLDVWVLVHQHHGDLFPGAGPLLSGFSFKSHQMSIGRQLAGVVLLAIGVQLHLEGVALLGGERWTEDGFVVRSVIHHLTEVFHSPYKLWAGGLREIDIVQWHASRWGPGTLFGPLEDNPKLFGDVQAHMVQLPQVLRGSCCKMLGGKTRQLQNSKNTREMCI